ncbi:hypothetical protein ACVC7V_24815 [Hydrogenophaga sp. A37]|uniref:hypothetical protein n=1 Tax=Hydrogenophaga sp. A37 TaxID=1945864 RepID=UPI000985AC93|nr:hypothetical protein [Hydrogenophaga sp. A37]OOG88656.1 hypothetical protein B0E41_02120 [Hydrogenophaga sp. A37]
MPDHTSEPSSSQSQRAWLYLLLGFTGGGLGALLALFAGAASWPDAKLFIVLGVAIGIALAVALAPNLLKPRHREASAPNR